MNNSNSSVGKTFFNTLKQIIQSLWKIILFGVYGCAKILETISVFIVKLTERMVNN